MKKYILIILIFNYFYTSFPQIYSGKLIDAGNDQPVAFVNIGIINKNVGIVSDANGYFEIELKSRFDNDSLRLSCIGNKSKSYL